MLVNDDNDIESTFFGNYLLSSLIRLSEEFKFLLFNNERILLLSPNIIVAI